MFSLLKQNKQQDNENSNNNDDKIFICQQQDRRIWFLYYCAINPFISFMFCIWENNHKSASKNRLHNWTCIVNWNPKSVPLDSFSWIVCKTSNYISLECKRTQRRTKAFILDDLFFVPPVLEMRHSSKKKGGCNERGGDGMCTNHPRRWERFNVFRCVFSS